MSSSIAGVKRLLRASCSTSRGVACLCFARALNLYGGALGTMGRLDQALQALQRAQRLNEELVKTAFRQTMTETPRSRPPQSSLANDRIQKIETTAS